MTVAGSTQEQICAIIGISHPTLEKHYRHELDTALSVANTTVARSLFEMATKDKVVAAAIFWMKTRARWRETAAGHDDEGKPFVVDTGVPRQGDD